MVVVENSTSNNKRRRINGQRERFCHNGHKIEKGYPLWYRKRLGNLPMNTSIQCCTCCPIATPVPAAIISSSSFHPNIITTTTNTLEQDDDVTWACIDCDFDMCTKCYTSKHSMEVLLHLHNTSSTRTSSSVFPIKEVPDTQHDDDDDDDDVIMKRNDHHYDNPGCNSNISRGFQDDKEEEMWHKPSTSTTALSCILLPSMPSKF